MREGLDPPTADLPPADVEALRAFLDGQRRVDLLVWVRHEQQGVDGPLYDHHLIFGVADDDYASGDMWALELGMPVPGLQFDGPTWSDIFPLSEVEELKTFGTVVWERDPARATDGDPLDFHLTSEPLEVTADAIGAFAALVGALPTVDRVEADCQRLWNNGAEQSATARFFVQFSERRPHDFDQIQRAIRDAGLQTTSSSLTASLPNDDSARTMVLYER
jgi:hypothetical protein